MDEIEEQLREERSSRLQAEEKLARRGRYERMASRRRPPPPPPPSPPQQVEAASKASGGDDDALRSKYTLIEHQVKKVVSVIAALIAAVLIAPVAVTIASAAACLVLITLPDGTPMKGLLPIDPSTVIGKVLLGIAALLLIAGAVLGFNVKKLTVKLHRSIANRIERWLVASSV